jgi:hypothetical protein
MQQFAASQPTLAAELQQAIRQAVEARIDDSD